MFQREPGWVIPKGDARLHRRGARRVVEPGGTDDVSGRGLLYMIEKGSSRGSIHRPGTKTNHIAAGRRRAYIDETFDDRPDLRAAVTPNYPYPGQAPDLRGTVLRGVASETNVELVPCAVESVTRDRARRRSTASSMPSTSS